jgi:hypothetical protein
MQKTFFQTFDERLPPIVKWLGFNCGPDILQAMRHPERSPFAWSGLPGIIGENDSGFIDNPKLRAPEPASGATQKLISCLAPSVTEEMQELAARLGYSPNDGLWPRRAPIAAATAKRFSELGRSGTQQ